LGEGPFGLDTPAALFRASASRPLPANGDDDFDVLANGVVVGRIFKANAAPVGSPWMWTETEMLLAQSARLPA
jgi:hypothetical protein